MDIAGISVLNYLKENNYNTGRIAVEYNGDILPGSLYSSTLLQDEDVLEIVSFVGGGPIDTEAFQDINENKDS